MVKLKNFRDSMDELEAIQLNEGDSGAKAKGNEIISLHLHNVHRNKHTNATLDTVFCGKETFCSCERTTAN